jgi:hypothetical protein
MKKKTLLLVITVLILTSCVKDEDRSFEGFSFFITNNASTVFENAEIVIGGMQNGVFMPTDSIKLPKLERLVPKDYHFDDNRWKPNLDKIRAIKSDRCYFKFKLSSQREELVGRYNKTELMSLLLPSGNTFKDDYGELLFTIQEDKVIGSAAKEL